MNKVVRGLLVVLIVLVGTVTVYGGDFQMYGSDGTFYRGTQNGSNLSVYGSDGSYYWGTQWSDGSVQLYNNNGGHLYGNSGYLYGNRGTWLYDYHMKPRHENRLWERTLPLLLQGRQLRRERERLAEMKNELSALFTEERNRWASKQLHDLFHFESVPMPAPGTPVWGSSKLVWPETFRSECEESLFWLDWLVEFMGLDQGYQDIDGN